MARCEATLVLGPVMVAPFATPMAGDGQPISEYPARDHRIRLFRADGSTALDVVRSSSGTDYLVVGAVDPGAYSAAIEVAGTSLVAGAELLPGGCPTDLVGSPWCRGISVSVEDCGHIVVPAALGCADATGTNCGVVP